MQKWCIGAAREMHHPDHVPWFVFSVTKTGPRQDEEIVSLWSCFVPIQDTFWEQTLQIWLTTWMKDIQNVRWTGRLTVSCLENSLPSSWYLCYLSLTTPSTTPSLFTEVWTWGKKHLFTKLCFCIEFTLIHPQIHLLLDIDSQTILDIKTHRVPTKLLDYTKFQ